MEFQVKKIRDEVLASDGYRIFIDRFWPRGISKSQFKVDYWASHMAPSAPLMKWFHEDRTAHFAKFQELYFQELIQNEDTSAFLTLLKRHRVVILVTDVHDVEKSHIPTIIKFVSIKLNALSSDSTV